MENRYELLYIVSTSFTDEEVGAVETKIGALITKLGAKIESTKRLGKYKLAYAIKDQRHGHYVMSIFSADGSALAKMEENLRINNDILRHLILRADEAGTDQKFELVQFNEIVVEGGRGDRRREKTEVKEVKEGEKAEAKEGEKTEVAAEAKPAAASEEKAA